MDQLCLQWIYSSWQLEGQVARWIQFLSDSRFKVLHRPRKQSCSADDLSRKEECKQRELKKGERIYLLKQTCPKISDKFDLLVNGENMRVRSMVLIPKWTTNQLSVWLEADECLRPV